MYPSSTNRSLKILLVIVEYYSELSGFSVPEISISYSLRINEFSPVHGREPSMTFAFTEHLNLQYSHLAHRRYPISVDEQTNAKGSESTADGDSVPELPFKSWFYNQTSLLICKASKMGVSGLEAATKQRVCPAVPSTHCHNQDSAFLCFSLCRETLHLLPVPRQALPPPSLWLTSTAWISPFLTFPPSVMQTQLAPLFFLSLFHTPRKPLCALLLLVFPYSIIILYFLGRLPHLLVTYLKGHSGSSLYPQDP